MALLPNANIPPATAQSGSTLASYHTGGQAARQCRQPRVSFAGQPGLRQGSHGRAEQGGLREGSRRKDESRESSCTTAHQQAARPISRSDTIFQDLGLTYLKDDLKTNKLQLLKIYCATIFQPAQHPGLRYFHSSNEAVFGSPDKMKYKMNSLTLGLQSRQKVTFRVDIRKHALLLTNQSAQNLMRAKYGRCLGVPS